MPMTMATPLVVLLLAFSASSFIAMGKSTKNPADALATIIDNNLTSSKLPKLHSSPGLACIALQYIQAYQGKCDDVGSSGKRPADDAFKSEFADNCGVDPSSMSKITSIVLACETVYRDADYAFSNLLFKESSSLQKLRNGNQSEFGVGISGYEGGGPYFWCVLFSNGSTSASFKFINNKPKSQKTGCFSGTGDACSGATTGMSISLFVFGFVLLVNAL